MNKWLLVVVAVAVSSRLSLSLFLFLAASLVITIHMFGLVAIIAAEMVHTSLLESLSLASEDSN